MKSLVLLLLFCIASLHPSHLLPIRLRSKAHNFMMSFGYMKRDTFNDLSAEWQGAILKMQKFAHLKLTGVLDEETDHLMEKPRCQQADDDGEESFRGSNKFEKLRKYFKRTRIITFKFRKGPRHFKKFRRYVKWMKKNNNIIKQIKVRTKRHFIVGMFFLPSLTYALINHPTHKINLTDQKISDTVRWAFDAWLEHATDIQIKETTKDKDPDLKVSFLSREHGDGFSFDGPGNVIGHTFYPSKGEIHLDDDETWSSGTLAGIHIEWVIIHEIGHALGLGHSMDPSAIMYPYYNGYRQNIELGADDIEGISAIYSI